MKRPFFYDRSVLTSVSDHLDSLLPKVVDFSRRHNLFTDGRRLLLAVSGGVDSMALLDLLNRLAQQQQIPPIGLCVHVNHQLRGAESDADEQLVRQETNQRNLPLVACSVDVRSHAREHRLSLETAGRALRMQFLLKHAQQSGCDVVVTAHHMDDNAETLMHRLLRGTGFRGLAGIHPERPMTATIKLVRPLLCLRRQQLLNYVQSQGIPWREDRSNRDCRFTRNQIRHRLLPALQAQAHCDLVEPLGALAAQTHHWQTHCRQQAQRLWQMSVAPSEQGLSMNCPDLIGQPPWVLLELFHLVLEHLDAGERHLRQWHYQALLNMVSASQTHKTCLLPGSIQVQRTADRLLWARCPSQAFPPPSTPQKVAIPGITPFGGLCLHAALGKEAPRSFQHKGTHVEWLDADKLVLPLCLRSRTNGDQFIPLGKHTPQKVGKFLGKSKSHSRTLIVEDQEKIIWVAPVRLSQAVRVTPQTRRVLRLELLQET